MSDHAHPATPLTIGLLINDIVRPYQRALWAGAEAAALGQDANLICVAGAELRSPHPFAAQRNRIYELIGAESFAGLVISSTLGNHISEAEFAAFCRRYRPLPMVSLAQPLPGMPSVLIDNASGMQTLMQHLIEVHNRRRIAFIQGPAISREAGERYRVYCATLAAYGLPFAPNLVVPGDFTQARGNEAVRLLCDERRQTFDALVAANDEMALGALEALRARGLSVPEKVAVAGFDDIEIADLALPPLTTVRQPLYAQSKQAVEILLAVLRGEPVAEQVILPSELVIRQSCGCLPASVSLAAHKSPAPEATVLSAVWNALGPPHAATAARLVEAFETELRGRSPGIFCLTLAELLDQGMAAGLKLDVWQDAISAMRRQMLPRLMTQPAKWLAADNLWQQARLQIGEAARRYQALRRLRAEQLENRLNSIGRELLTTFDLEELVNLITPPTDPHGGLPGLGIRSAYMALYAEPTTSLERARLIMVYNDTGRRPLPPEELFFPASRLVPLDLLPHGRRYNLLLEPLYFLDEHLGYILLELGPEIPGSLAYETLREQLSTAVKGALLMEQVLEKKREAEQANQAKSEFLSRMSHELRTPLNSILGFAQLLELDSLPAEQQAQLQDILKASRHLLALINEVLDISRIESGRFSLTPEAVNLPELLREALELVSPLAAAGGIRLTLDYRLTAGNLTVWADRQRLKQVLLNLLSNGIKYNHSGGNVTVDYAEPAPGRLRLEFTDSGPGIAPEKLARLFTPFDRLGAEQTGVEGTGLGLVLSKRLIEAMQGTIGVESEVGQGSTFWIELRRIEAHRQPLADMAAEIAAPPTVGDKSATRGLVLYAEDNLANIALIRGILAHRPGVKLIEVMQGSLALDFVAEHRPDLILLDLHLPDLPGEEVVRRLQADELTRNIPIVVVSGDAIPARIEQLRAAGVHEYLAKPIDVKQFLEVLDRLLLPPIRS